MPFLRDISLFPQARLIVWRLEEEAARLMKLCREEGFAVEDLAALPAKRQRERAAERLLLMRAFGRAVALRHDGQGAPYVDGETVNISISHTSRLVVLACSDTAVIGVDAESLDRQQVLRVRDKFLNDSEKRFLEPDDLTAHIVAWTVKEAVIKAERNSGLDWTDGIQVEPFVTQWDAAGQITLVARCGGHRYRLACRLMEGHCVTVAVPMPCESRVTGQ